MQSTDTIRNDGGVRHVFRIALPLIMSQMSFMLMAFIDRIFLARYDTNAMAGAMFAGLVGWTTMSLFMGTSGYTGTFVAQYFGARGYDRISTAVWHGAYFAAASGLLMLVVSCFAQQIMRFAGHPPAAQAEEVIYFRIFIGGGGLVLMFNALSGFYGGIGKTHYNMLIHIPGHCLNLFLNYALIFGKFGFPRWGTRGAAVATVTSWAFICLTFVVVMRFGKVGRSYGVLRKPVFEGAVLARLLKFGLPSGVQWTVDMLGWTIFVMLVCRIGVVEQHAVSVAFSINHLAFMPMIGFGIAASILVGQFIGAGNPGLAQRATFSAFKMTFVYMALIASVFAFCPGPLVRLFRPSELGEHWPKVYDLAAIFMRFVAVYCLFDAVNIVYSSALKGAGDTRFVMYMIAALSLFGLVIPGYIAISVLEAGLYAAAALVTVYMGMMALAFYLRYRGGKWKSMRVIEAVPAEEADGLPK